ncbi:HUS1 checkpoint protein [Strigomonas culicis]|nr:HUS1 checkpoint protein [Strigomonas culicis]|eukprot:EPY24582.1 HUS1 checkpoint protein [Strigomonas culicis]
MTEGAQVWIGCKTNYVFSDFRVDSSLQDKSITCEILDMNQLFHALKQADTHERHHGRQYRTEVRLKQQGNRPLLKFTMGGGMGQPDLSFNVFIRILCEKEIESIIAPPLDDNNLQIVVPNLQELMVFVERLKNTSCTNIVFRCQTNLSEEDDLLNGHGKRPRPSTEGDGGSGHTATFVVYAEHFLASFCLKYENVERVMPRRSEEDEDEEEPEQRNNVLDQHVSVTVEMKQFARFFAAVGDVNPLRMSMYLVDQRALVLSVHANNGNTTMVAYIPAMV